MHPPKFIHYLFLFLFFGNLAYSQSNSITEKRTLLDSICKEKLINHNYPGMAVMISQNGKIIFEKGYGYADLDKNSLVIPDKSLFRIGSVSKSLTSAGLAILVQNKTINLDAPIQKYVPYFPIKKHKVTIRDLACHRSGIRHYRGLEFMYNKEFSDVKSGIEIFKDDDLEFAPGEKYKYSSYGWNLISAAMEGAAGKDFLSFMKEEVFVPLKMHDTYAEKESFKDENIVAFYNQNDQGKLMYAMPVNNSYKWAGGGFLSTAENLILFADGILENKLYNNNIREIFWTSCSLSDGSKTNYGLGWIDNIDDSGRKFVGHSGGSVGGTSMLLIYPEEKLVIVVLINQSQANMDRLSMNLAQVILE